MKSFSADTIFDGFQFISNQQSIIINDEGKIIDIVPKTNDTVCFKGFLLPGFINCHCHLELSFLKNEIEPHKGLVHFIQQLVKKRTQFDADFIQQKIKDAHNEMLQNGIVAVGDISNGLDTLSIKKNKEIYYHTFVECFGLNHHQAETIVNKAISIKNEFEKNQLASVVLHAPYSITSNLIELVKQQSENAIATIHNQETDSENELFEKGTGALKDFFTNAFPVTPDFLATQKTSLQNYFAHFSAFKNSILVHNTFTSKTDIDFAITIDTNTFWCLCPQANLYIENTLPNAPLLYNENCQVVFGTDSLASNYALNILEEMLIIKNRFPEIELEKLLQSITSVGAKALGVENQFGSFEINKQPNFVVIENWENVLHQNEKPIIKNIFYGAI